jgi:hypothetical protein
MTRSDAVHIYVDLERFGQPALMGALHCQQILGVQNIKAKATAET